MRGFVYRLSRTLEKGPFVSHTIREILKKYHGVAVGAYSYGPCLVPGAFPSGVTIGRYVSIANGVKIFLRNHPIEDLSLHPFFYNSKLGFLEKDSITTGTLSIGHDAWIGEGAMITPGCRSIGIGAIVGAGALVTKDVPDFAIVAGNPARVLRYRFDPDVVGKILGSKWWNLNMAEIVPYLSSMTIPLRDSVNHPLLGGQRYADQASDSR